MEYITDSFDMVYIEQENKVYDSKYKYSKNIS